MCTVLLIIKYTMPIYANIAGLAKFLSDVHCHIAAKASTRLYKDYKNIQMWMKPLADLGNPNVSMQAAAQGEAQFRGHTELLKSAIRGFVSEDEAQGRIAMFLDASPECCFMKKDAAGNTLAECDPTDEALKQPGYYYLKINIKWIFFKNPQAHEDSEMIGKLRFELAQVGLIIVAQGKQERLHHPYYSSFRRFSCNQGLMPPQ